MEKDCDSLNYFTFIVPNKQVGTIRIFRHSLNDWIREHSLIK